MKDNDVRLYSAGFRVLVTIVILAYSIAEHFSRGTGSDFGNSLLVFLVLFLVSLNIVFHVTEKFRILGLVISIAVTLVLYFLISKTVLLLFALYFMDCVVLLKANPTWSLTFLVLLPYCGGQDLAFIVFVLAGTFSYYLLFAIFPNQAESIEEAYRGEQRFVVRLREMEKKHKLKLENVVLQFENQRLQEKSELSQNLHDKIGHAINGSIFKLEAAKLLMDRDANRSSEMVGDVILTLRESVDEIRVLLRNERPSHERLNLVRLKALFSSFTEKYGIGTQLDIMGDTDRISLTQYAILYDNTVEVLSNSLKYASCSEISASIGVYNRIMRYTIRDNGVGATYVNENMGLSGIRSRVVSAGGSVTINGEHGFEINMLIPMP